MKNVTNFSIFNIYLKRGLDKEFSGVLTTRDVTFIATTFAHLFKENNNSTFLALTELREIAGNLAHSGDLSVLPERVYSFLSCHATSMFESAYRNTSEVTLFDEL